MLVAAPLLPTIGFHLTQARRLFRTGYSLVDLREAIARDDRERVDAVVIPEQRALTVPQWYLRLVAYGSAAQSAIAATMMMAGVGQLHAGRENIRLDLLRLHAGEADPAPITTLLDAARAVGVDVERLMVAQREVAVVRRVPRPHGARRTPTPASGCALHEP